jgi:hypothetical protein
MIFTGFFNYVIIILDFIVFTKQKEKNNGLQKIEHIFSVTACGGNTYLVHKEKRTATSSYNACNYDNSNF